MTTESKNLVLERYVKGRENKLIEAYISDGPTDLREKLGLEVSEWRIVFDYLVFEKNLLFKTVVNATDFFVNEYIKSGAAHIRGILDVTEKKYDGVWQMVFDFLAIANEGLHLHVLEHREKYIASMKIYGSDFVRKVLGIWGEKYEENWRKVLDFLLHAVCTDIFSENTFDRGLSAFSKLYNGIRVQRRIDESGLLI